jgi:hypothetical protein
LQERADVIPIGKLNIPLFYFDKFGHPQRNPSQVAVLDSIVQRLHQITDGEPFDFVNPNSLQ